MLKLWCERGIWLLVSRRHSVRDKSTVSNAYIVRILRVNDLILPEHTIERLIDYTQNRLIILGKSGDMQCSHTSSAMSGQ